MRSLFLDSERARSGCEFPINSHRSNELFGDPGEKLLPFVVLYSDLCEMLSASRAYQFKINDSYTFDRYVKNVSITYIARDFVGWKRYIMAIEFHGKMEGNGSRNKIGHGRRICAQRFCPSLE